MNNQSIARLRKLLENKTVVAVGECGLDFDRDFSPRDIQEQCYKDQLELAIEVQKPLFLHERTAFTRFMAVTKNYLPQLFYGNIGRSQNLFKQWFLLRFYRSY